MTQMKRVMLGLALAVTMSCSTGCEMLQKRGGCNSCNSSCNGAVGCRPCRLGWQRGGTDYQRLLSHSGSYGHATPAGHTGGAGGGGATAQVAYPYYTARGPRDFFVNNPPTIGR